MKLKLKKGNLKEYSDILYELPLKGTESRHRTKLIKIINSEIEEVDQQRIELAKEYSQKDKDGAAIVEEGIYKVEDLENFRKSIADLYNEDLIVGNENEQDMLKGVKKALLNSNEVYEGKEAMTYDYLCSQLEEEVEED